MEQNNGKPSERTPTLTGIQAVKPTLCGIGIVKEEKKSMVRHETVAATPSAKNRGRYSIIAPECDDVIIQKDPVKPWVVIGEIK